ncbi:hypothetical protein [Photobacterium leiognathi]|uniref:hypothetical protein n=1 Tax=Photobacterium leiognathi TaxID=553611 RepID=UPI0006975832|nr:hypothetical protein [Photobacterium leiognathi]
MELKISDNLTLKQKLDHLNTLIQDWYPDYVALRLLCWTMTITCIQFIAAKVMELSFLISLKLFINHQGFPR